jgi:hypothetical protein
VDKPVRCSCCQQEKTGKGCEHGFPCHCMERRVCVECNRCERHCRCAEPNLHESYVDALAAMRGEIRGEATADQGRRILRTEKAA